jgi:Leucine-rich repeat (LRR) protein
MSTFNIEEYLNSLPDYITEIDISSKNLIYLPSLERFYNLKILKCFNNKLKSLPELNTSLTRLDCFSNELISLPKLNDFLIQLSCANNNLTELPELNESLEYLDCYKNLLTKLPKYIYIIIMIILENIFHLSVVISEKYFLYIKYIEIIWKVF